MTQNMPPQPPFLNPPPPPVQPPFPPPWWVTPPKPRWGRRILRVVVLMLLALSILLNIELGAMLTLSGAHGMDKSVLREGQPTQTIALYTIGSMIGDKTAQEFSGFYQSIRDDHNVKAVVLRVDSPGGAIAPSDEIHTMIRKMRHDLHKPVLVSMGGLAASGGYYISAPADQIFAEPTTVTGSIGVIAVWPVVKDLLTKHGVDVVTIRSTASQVWKARENFWENPPDRTRADVQKMLNEMQARFEEVVRAGRGDKLQIKELRTTMRDEAGKETVVTEVVPFNGKTYLANEAMELGLVDRIGYLGDVLDAAAATANLAKPRVVHYAQSKSFREQLGFAEALGGVTIDTQAAETILTPRILMLWKVD